MTWTTATPFCKPPCQEIAAGDENEDGSGDPQCQIPSRCLCHPLGHIRRVRINLQWDHFAGLISP